MAGISGIMGGQRYSDGSRMSMSIMQSNTATSRAIKGASKKWNFTHFSHQLLTRGLEI